MNRLSGKVVIVTGGASGIGEASVRMVASEGAKVVITDIDESKGRDLAAEIGEDAIFIKHDVADADGWHRVVEEAENAFGSISGLVNNAGIVGPNDVPLVEVKDEDFRRVIDINLYSVFKGTQVVGKAMMKNQGGSIVNISSSSGLVGSVMVSSYVTTKFALRGLTKAAALELSEHNIRVNSVHPGGIKTNIEVFDAVKAATPLGRIAEPEEVANMILYLLSDESSFSTGSEFVVDGGFTAQ